MKLVAWLSTCSLALLGCALPPPPDVDHDADPRDAAADAAIDASVDAGPDANTACVPDSVVCEADHYTQCSSAGVVEVEMDCPLGCDAPSSRCRDVDPSNGVAVYLDMARDGAAPDLVLQSGSTINTDTGVVFDGTTSVVVPNVDHEVSTGLTHRVFMVKSLLIAGTTKVTGSRGLIVVSNGDIELTSTLDISADGAANGPGASTSTCTGGSSIVGSGFTGGGGGGGNATTGAYGGDGNNLTVPAGTPGAALADEDLDFLRGGCAGGRADRTGGGCVHHGGGGGGAAQLVSRTEFRMTASGVIDASGGGGQAGVIGVDSCVSTSIRGGGGGGAGGSVLVEAPTIVLNGAGVAIGAHGGGGAAAGVGATRAGGDGQPTGAAAPGGVNLTLGLEGGDGGTVGMPPMAGMGGGANQDGSGGGGAAGRARMNTVAGTFTLQAGAVVNAASTTGVLRVRLVP